MTQQKPHSTTAAGTIKKFLQVWGALLVPVWVLCQTGLPAAEKITGFPFTMLTGGVVIVKATLNDHPDSLTFILDTGSGGISLDSATVSNLDLPVTPSNRTIKGIAGVRTVSFVLQQTLQLPGIAVPYLDFHINDYEILTRAYGLKIDGIIGFSFLRRYIVKLDFDHQMMEVWTQGKMEYPRYGYRLKPQLNFIPVVTATVKDAVKKKARLYFDTGAGLCLLLTEDYVRDSAVLKTKRKIIQTQGEGLGGKKLMRLTTLQHIKLGPYRFKKVPAHILDDEYGLTNYPELGGLVGNDLLRRFNMVINYSDTLVHLKPNKHFAAPFDYSYTGLGIYLIDGEIVVEDVIPGSPGEKAGLQPGDVIVAIEKSMGKSLQHYKALLQTPHARLHIIVRRNEELVELKLKVGSIK